jgi:pyridoxal phosphate-dependent aminotransferase EpsN
MTRSRIYLSPPHMSGLEQQYINEAFSTNWIAPLGPNVEAFEAELAECVGVRHALALSSGTAGIHLALDILGVNTGDVVFCSSLTFVASANPILYRGATPVFIDSEPTSWNMSPQALADAFEYARKRNKLPKAVIVTNLYGQSADMDPIISLCNQYEVPIIEDAAESLGARYKGRPSGTFGYFGIYSFNGNKIITTSGGGALVSDDETAIKTARFLATQARDPARHYQHSRVGYNYRMSNILAGIGRAQLKVLAERVEARRTVFKRYYDALHEVPGIEFMPEPSWSYATRWLTTLTISPEESGVSRDCIISALENENIECRPVWKPLHMQPLYKDALFFAHGQGTPVSEFLFENGICLPSGSSLSEEEQDFVICTMLATIQKQQKGSNW